MVELKPVRLIAMHHQHLALGATMVERDGWQRPAAYGPVEEELRQLRTNVGLLDISPVGKLSIQGAEAEAHLSAVFPDVPVSKIGGVCQISPASLPESGAVVLARLAHDEFLALTSPGQAAAVTELLEAPSDGCAHTFDLTSALAGARVTGPSAHSLLAAVSGFDSSLSSFLDMSCAQTKAAEIHAVILRLDLDSVSSYELYFGRDFGEYMWEALLEAAEEFGGGPVGLDAMARLQE